MKTHLLSTLSLVAQLLSGYSPAASAMPIAVDAIRSHACAPALYGDHLSGGDTLLAGQFLASPNGRYRVYVQTDGNMVIYRTDTWASIWTSGTWDPPNPTMRLVLTSAGRLTLSGKTHTGYHWAQHLVNYNPYTGQYTYAWAWEPYQTQLYREYAGSTVGAPVLYMQNDGNLVLYDTSNWSAKWSSGSWQG